MHGIEISWIVPDGTEKKKILIKRYLNCVKGSD
jgi:hypothetical protein